MTHSKGSGKHSSIAGAIRKPQGQHSTVMALPKKKDTPGWDRLTGGGSRPGSSSK